MSQSKNELKAPSSADRVRLSPSPWLLIVYGAGLLGILNLGFWVADAVWRGANPQYTGIYGELPSISSWTEAVFLNVPPYPRFLRAMFLGISVLIGVIYTLYVLHQNRLTKELHKSEQRYHVLFDHAPIGLAITTPEGHLHEHNTALRQIRQSTDMDPDPFNVLNWYVAREDRDRLLKQLHEKGRVQHFETSLKRANGDIYEASLTASLITLDGEAVILTVIEDVTEANRLKEKLLSDRSTLARQVEEHTAALLTANAELTQALRVKDEFLAIMSHELRTPLTIMMTLADNLYQEIYGPLSDRQRMQLRTVQESGYNLLSLINDLVDLAKIGAGQLKLQMTLFSVAQVCELAMQTVRAQAQKKDIALSIEVDPAVDVMVADAGRVRQMLTKLLHNAVKFTPAGGKAGLEVHGDADQAGVHFVVWDNGIGIPPEKIGQLFQSFHQLDTSSTRDHDGTGVGLALVDRLTHLHEGIVSVQSHPGEGSRFTISLPWRKP